MDFIDEKQGSVYVLLSRVGNRNFAKVGITKQGIKKRMHKLQTGCPGKLSPCFRLEAPVSKLPEIEKRIHILLKDQHSSGEWFKWNSGVRAKLWFELCLISHDHKYELFHFKDGSGDPDLDGEKIRGAYVINNYYALKYKKLRGSYLSDELYLALLEKEKLLHNNNP